MLKLVSFIDSLPRVRGKKRTSKTANVSSSMSSSNEEPAKKSSSASTSSKRTFGKISKIGIKRRSTVPENDIVKDLIPLSSNDKTLLDQTCWSSSIPVVSVTGCYTLPLNRPQIRTNPWCKPKPLIPSLDLWNTLPKKTTDQTANDITKDIIDVIDGRDKTLEDSIMCSSMSSGYGSRDSSPASSVHTPDWQMRISIHQQLEPQSCIEEVIHCEDVGLQCNMTEDKSVDCTEADFGFEEEDDKVQENIRIESNIVISELNRKISELQVKAQRMKRCVELAKEERERRSREKQLCQEQLRFIRQLKLAISSGFEVIV